MFSIIDKVLVFLVLVNFYKFVFAGDILKDDNMDNKRSDNGGIWFGPRLGKRALNIVSEDTRPSFLRLLEAADALKYYYDQLQYANFEAQADDPGMKLAKKVIFTPKLGRSLNDEKRYDYDFRPRLGRHLEDMQVTPSDQDFRSFWKDEKRHESILFTPRIGKRPSSDDNDSYRVEADQVESRNKYFSPRLGRTMNFSPRLGRELTYELYPDKIRVVRSINKTNST